MDFKHFILFLFFSALVSGCVTRPDQPAAQGNSSGNADNFYVVDCLLPGQIRKLGQLATYLTARRPIKTTAVDCEIRGGEYVAYDRASYATSLKVWLPKAQAGDAESQVYVGEIYEKGLGLSPDYQMAEQWYRKAAEQGNSRAQINLGFLYEKGLGVPQDRSKAMEWYRKSSGLESTNIPYATTLETVTSNPDEDQISLLETELKNSRNEAKILANQLAEKQKQLEETRDKLVSSGSQLDQAKVQLGQASVQTDDAEKRRLQKVIRNKEQEITQQRKSLDTIENQYKNKVNALNTKLDETEKRARQISTDMKSHKIAANESQLKLLDTQAQLANTEKRLLQLNSESLAKADVEKLTQAQQTTLDQNQKEIQKIQQTLEIQENAKRQQEQLIAQLEAEKKAYRENIERLQIQLQSSSVSVNEVKQLKQELQKEKQAAELSKQKLQTTQIQLTKSEEQLSNLENQVAEERTKFNNATSTQNDKDNVQIDQQQMQISQLESEKQRYEETIKQLQAKNQGSTDQPKIEIIEPPFVSVRGTPTVTLRSVVDKGNLIGKVTTSSGLLSLVVNDIKQTVDDRGLFQASVNLAAKETPVHVAAIDKNGRRANLDFVFSLGNALKANQGAANQGEQKPVAKPWKAHDFGNYYALIIGNSDYQKIPRLDTPVNDARAVEKVLKQKYGFKTKLLINATRYQILSELNKLRGKLTEKDNLMIYYAGHGELDNVNMRGHWLPVDADADNTANWISTVALTDILNAMSVKHILVVADSCYSGAMTRASLARLDSGVSAEEKSEWLKAMLKARSRTVLTSGGLKPVMDGGGGDHSVFAKAFINALRNNNDLLEGQVLYRNVSSGIVSIAAQYGIEQVPVYAPIRYAGHENGEFFFVPI